MSDEDLQPYLDVVEADIRRRCVEADVPLEIVAPHLAAWDRFTEEHS